jgi:hypothetical protein
MKGHAKPIKLKPGQFITGQHSLHKGLCGDVAEPSSRTVWRWLHALKDLEMLAVDSGVSNRFSIVTVCNWKTYQAAGTEGCHEHVKDVSSTCQADVKPVSTNKKVKNADNGKNGNNIPAPLRAIWKEWEQHRAEKKKPLTPLSIKKQLKLLAQYDTPTAIEIINTSIRGGYQGLFPPKGQNQLVPESTTIGSKHVDAYGEPLEATA